MNDFSRHTLRQFAKVGIKVLGMQLVPDFSSEMPYANGTRAYIISDNGTGRVLGFADLLQLAADRKRGK